MAFHPYPQVIPSVFNRSGFGPPQSLTSASACPWIDHPASRLRQTTKRHLKGSLSLRLVSKLNLAAHRNSLAHSTKGTPSHHEGAPTACRHTVSGTISLPSRGTFHLSLTVLVQSGLPRFIPGFTCPALLRYLLRRCCCFAYGAFTPSGRPFHAVLLQQHFVTTSNTLGWKNSRPYNTSCSNALKLTRAWVWAGALSLAATRAISVDFFSSGYLDVSVPRVASSVSMCSTQSDWALPQPGSPIRKSAVHNG